MKILKYCVVPLVIANSFISLAACKPHVNVLEKADKSAVVLFLVDASRDVERRQHLSDNMVMGFLYGDCMAGKVKPKKHCRTLYKGMVHYAKQHHQFKGLRQRDLKDKKLWRRVSKNYMTTMLNH